MVNHHAGEKPNEGIIHEWNKMSTYPVHEFTHTDELSDTDDDVIINKSRLGAEFTHTDGSVVSRNV